MDKTEPTTERPVVLWDCDKQAEILNHKTRNDAILAHLDSVNKDDWPETLTVYGSARMVIREPAKRDAGELVYAQIETRWGEYLGEEDWDITQPMVDAAAEFLSVLHREFVPWACEIVTSVDVDVAEWVAERQRP